MAKFTDGNILDTFDDLEASSIEVCSRGVKLSRIVTKLKSSIDITPLLGKFQQLGLVKIVYNPSVDKDPLVQFCAILPIIT